MQLLLLILQKIAPIFIIITIGFIAFRLKWIDTPFIQKANILVFKVAMPVLVFSAMRRADFSNALPAREFAGFSAGLIGAFLIALLIAAVFGLDRRRKSAFVTTAVRGNFAILAFAVIERVVGPQVMDKAAIYFAFFMPFHTIAGIIILIMTLQGKTEDGKFSIQILKGIGNALINPLMIAAYLGFIVSITGIILPELVIRSLDYLTDLALPLALIGIGGSMLIYYHGGHIGTALAASIIKLIAMPLAAVLLGALMGLSSEALVMLFIFAGAPSAISTYALVSALGADQDTAGSVIFLSHALCFITLTAGITLIRLIFG
jgi:hypothetical protein